MKKIILWGGGALLVAGALFVVGRIVFEDPHVAEGRTLFRYYCAQCHGTKGRGDGFNAETMDPRPRDLTDRGEPYMQEASNEQIYEVISRDMKEEEKVTDPDEEWVPGSMPTFKYTLSDAERWSLVSYLRTLHKNDADPIDFTKPMEAMRPEIQADATVNLDALKPDQRNALVEKGHHLYESKFMCSSCHRIGEKGGKVGPDLSRSGVRLNTQWMYRWTKYPEGIRPETKMPSLGLTDDEAIAVTAYLDTLRASETSP